MGVPIIDPNTPPLEIVKVPPAISSKVIFPFLPLSAKATKFFSTSEKLQFSQFLNTGTINPLGVATATEISTQFLYTISLPSITAFNMGYFYNPWAAAFTKKDMNPNLVSCFFQKSFQYLFLISITLDISHSQKVVNKAYVF